MTSNGQDKFNIEANPPTFSIGMYSVTVTVSLVNDPSINRAFSFDVVVLDPCENTQVSFAQASTDMEVIVGSNSPFEQTF